MDPAILALILHYSTQYGVDPVVSIAVAQVESGMNPKAENKATHDVGLYQLHQETFRDYTKDQLFNPETNVKLGIHYLSQLKETCIHQKDNTWTLCFNLGPEKAKKVKHPTLFPYYKKINAAIIAEKESNNE